MQRPVVAFLIVSCFGLLFVGCGKPPSNPGFEEFTFTAEDIEKMYGLEAPGMSGDMLSPSLTLSGSAVASGSVIFDLGAQERFDALRSVAAPNGNVYQVTNQFLNVREGMSVSSRQIATLDQGDPLEVIEIPNASWAKVRLNDGQQGYVSMQYIAKLTTEENLPAEQKKYEGQYFVDYQFLNVRKEPNAQSEKIAELPSSAIIKPLSIDGQWARVVADGKEGYVSSAYLRPFSPSFLVRQESYTVPLLRYRADETGSIDAMKAHLQALVAAGKQIQSLRSLYDVVLQQQDRDARVHPEAVIVTVSGVNAQNVKAVSDALNEANVNATLFIETKDLGLTGITEKTVLTLLANGYDLQSAGHTGDDLRGLTDSQVELELSQSKKLLEQYSRKEVYAVAYPKGGVNDRITTIAAKAGYLFGVGEVPEKEFRRSEFLKLPSIAIGSSLSAEDVVKLVD